MQLGKSWLPLKNVNYIQTIVTILLPSCPKQYFCVKRYNFSHTKLATDFLQKPIKVGRKCNMRPYLPSYQSTLARRVCLDIYFVQPTYVYTCDLCFIHTLFLHICEHIFFHEKLLIELTGMLCTSIVWLIISRTLWNTLQWNMVHNSTLSFEKMYLIMSCAKYWLFRSRHFFHQQESEKWCSPINM